MANGNGSSMSWQKTLVAIVLILGLTALGVLSLLRDRIVNQPQWTVSVTGEGRVKYTSDIAYVTLGVQVDKAASAQEALNQINTKITKAVAAIKATGIPAEDVLAQNYSLYPQYDYRDNVQTLSGYTANQQVKITVRTVDKSADMISTVIAAAAKEGVNQVVGVQFSASQINELKNQARLLAIADARSKSGALANAAGIRLGKVVGWWENQIYTPDSQPMYYGGGEGRGGGGVGTGTIPVGTQELVLEINLNYKIK